MVPLTFLHAHDTPAPVMPFNLLTSSDSFSLKTFFFFLPPTLTSHPHLVQTTHISTATALLSGFTSRPGG